MPTERKLNRVRALQEKLANCTIAVATDPSDMPVNVMNELRTRFRDKGLEYVVVKNTLAYLAAEAAGTPHLVPAVQGPTALLLGYHEPADAAVALEEYFRTTRTTFTVRGGILGSRYLSPQDVTVLATLPPRDVLVGRLLSQMQTPMATLLGQLQAPLQRLLAALNDPIAQLASLLQQRSQQLDGPVETTTAGETEAQDTDTGG